MSDFPYDKTQLLQDPGAMLELIEYLYHEIELLKAQLAKYTSPHIPSSKQLFPEKKSGLPRTKATRKRGGSKKEKRGVTWDQGEPDEIIHNHVVECQNCHKTVSPDHQKLVYTKRILEIPEKITVELQEHYVYKHK